jgi:DNA-binding response OmpR family regulator
VRQVPRLLLIEDDESIRSVLMRALTDRGFAVASAPDGMAGLRLAVRSTPDLVLLDLGLPDVDGSEILRMLRAVSSVPVIIVTARDDEGVAIEMLNVGADDYVVKPFGAEHLEARIRAVLRRSGREPAPILRVGELRVDPRAREALLGDKPLDLTPREFDMLVFLAARPGQVVTKRELLAEVWRQPYGGAEKTVDVHLSWLRRKLGEPPGAPRYLHTVRGVGVKLVEP